MEPKKARLYQILTRSAAAATVVAAAAITTHNLAAQNPPAPIPPFSVCSQNVNVLSLLPPPPGGTPNPNEDGDTQFLNALMNTTEAALLREVPTASSMDLSH